MANVTVKDIPDDQLAAITVRARAEGLSTQAYLRRLIAREAAIPLLPDQIRALTDELIATRTPISMEEFDEIRRRNRRYR
jgi:plasmid stability protein